MGAQRFLNQRPSAVSDPLRNFRFVVKFIPYGENLGVTFTPTLGFISISGLSMQTEFIPYREGGFHTSMHFLPGQQTFSPVTMQRGMVLGSTQHWDWWTRIFNPGFNVQNDNAALTGEFRCEIVISILAHPQPLIEDYDQVMDDDVVARVRLMNAWPTNLSYGDLQAGDSAVWVEQIQFVHEGLIPELGPKPDGSAASAGAWPTNLLPKDPTTLPAR